MSLIGFAAKEKKSNTNKENKFQYLFNYSYGCFSKDRSFMKVDGEKPDSEVHILEVFPELSKFYDYLIPDTYLKKIYYEINDLGNKKLIR